MEPLRFIPILKRIRWGGVRLGTQLQKPVGSHTDYAESWEIADHGTDQSVVVEGEFAGISLTQLIGEHSRPLFGTETGIEAETGIRQFPLLIKFLDANDWLSLQVHPNDQQAKSFDLQKNGKTEAWVIMDAAPDSRICAGLKSGVTEVQLRESIQDGTVESCLNMIPVRAGDCVFVPAGTVHAIGPGILLAEIQQQSNLTFRLHDWGRLGTDGKPREIHIEESIACTDFSRGPVFPSQPTKVIRNNESVEELCSCAYFTVYRHRTDTDFSIPDDGKFRILMSLDGAGTVQTRRGKTPLTKGSTILLPAQRDAMSVVPQNPVTVLEIFQP
jgi:mannose-6-phosphate isomerase